MPYPPTPRWMYKGTITMRKWMEIMNNLISWNALYTLLKFRCLTPRHLFLDFGVYVAYLYLYTRQVTGEYQMTFCSKFVSCNMKIGLKPFCWSSFQSVLNWNSFAVNPKHVFKTDLKCLLNSAVSWQVFSSRVWFRCSFWACCVWWWPNLFSIP